MSQLQPVGPTRLVLSRRQVLGATALAAASVLGAAGAGAQAQISRRPQWYVPAEHVPHRRTWMAWASRRRIWGSWLPGAQADIALIARTIARYEPVVMCARDAAAARVARAMCGSHVEVIDSIPVDDCWMRDSGPVFRLSGDGRLGAVGLGFNGWGGKQVHRADHLVAQRVARRAGAVFTRAGVVGEGGGVECDGAGTLMATQSCWANANRNPGLTRDEIEQALLRAYGATSMIWLRGLRGRDITDDHIDATSRFVRPGVVLVQVPPRGRDDVWARDARRQHRELRRATDASGRSLDIIEVPGPRSVRSSFPGFVDSYVNYALVNGAVITAQFGDHDRDRTCHRILSAAFPGREVVQLNLDRLYRGGGGVHCVTSPQPARP